MGRQRFTVENIVRKLREAEVDLSRGQGVAQVVKKLGVCALPPVIVPLFKLVLS
jgi:hypothetical protein